jgi:trigger factor
LSSADTEKQEAANPEIQPETAETQPSIAEQAPQLQDGMNPALRREITVEIPAEVAHKEWDELIQSYAKRARVPGFRHGKVPASVIRNRFAREIRSDILESLVPRHFRQAYQKEGLMPISQPLVRDLEMEDGQPIRFKAAFEVLPEIELGQYQDIKVEKPETAVSDEEVENEIKRLQEERTSFDPVNEDRPLQDGDFAQVSFKAVPKPAPVLEPQGESAAVPTEAPAQEREEVLVEIGGAHTIAEFSENLRGLKPGEERTFDVSYPADFYDNRLAGQSLSYTVKVNGLKKKTTPELTDEFAKELSQEFQTMEDLRKRMREGMEHQRKHQAEHQTKEKLMDQLVAQHDFPVPEALVIRQIDIRLERGLRALAAQGMREEDMKRLDFDRLRGAQRDAALKEVKGNMLLNKIAQAENIEVGDDELDREIGALARQANQTPEAVRKQLSENGAIESMRNRMRGDKALEWLYGKSA